MSDPKQTYQYEPLCTRTYDGLECDGPCTVCDGLAADRADEADYNRREDEALRAWLDTTPGSQR
jgi:hypothetical protein